MNRFTIFRAGLRLAAVALGVAAGMLLPNDVRAAGSPPQSEGAARTSEASLAREARAPLALYVFDCGRIRFASIEGFSIEDHETDVRELAVPCYVVEHEKGRLLWDAGLPSSLAEKEGWQGEGMQQRLERTFTDQLAEAGLDMASFDYMAFSHFHFDHVGTANEVEGATLLISQAEYDAAFADPVTTPGFVPELYSNLRDAERVIVGEDHDVFGDGRVRIVAAPGHTPGHQVLFVDLAETGPIVLSGDLYHFRFSREHRRVPSFNTDREQTLVSMDRVDALLEETGAELWIQHELAHFGSLDRAPAAHR
jgi:glyoxylase-like metal-dependent hydrolase (beta-lactamase superfamily II)